ncbi:dipeptidyl-peptidase 3 family protein [Pendulispora albinea]|uniref:Peptidase family M49 n=1 Tax=Pendulispora albinea TaxID=2741071 RepID=A0ABZ2M8G3_9BACT
MRFLRRCTSLLAVSSTVVLAAACGGSSRAPAPPTPPPAPDASAPVDGAVTAPSLAERVKQFAPVRLMADVSKLPPSEKAALEKLVAAAKLMDSIFTRQAYRGNVELRASLASDTSPDGKAKLGYFDLMRGPWDRQDHFKPFAIEREHPKGAGFYPEDLTVEDFKAYVSAHPAEKAKLEDERTVVERNGDKLVAVPYSTAYAEWLKPAAALLLEAAKLTSDKNLKTFLTARAAAFASNDYYASDKAWMDLDGSVEITIGPYETYEDELLGLKASYESFVTVADPAASEKLAKYKKLLPAMEAHLPIPKELQTKRGGASPIRVVDLVYSSGDARKSVQTIAFNLPNDERVRKEKGAKKVLLRNLIEKKFDVIMQPIAQRVLAPGQLKNLSADAFFHEVLFHELSHSLGPAFVTVGGKKVEVRAALGESHAAIEEPKADVMGVYNLLYMIERGELPKDMHDKILVSYFAGLLRGVRFGVAEAHGQGNALQINRYLEDKAVTFDEPTGRFSIDLPKLEESVTKLVRDICMLQAAGDKASVDGMLAKYGVESPPIARATTALTGIPVDVAPVYPIAGEY